MRLGAAAKNRKFIAARYMMDSPVAGVYMREREAYHHTRYVKRCDVVVDGFPRSANTYFWFVLKATIEPKYVVRGHTHSVSTLKAAISDGKPAILVIRDPDSSVASLYQMLEGVTLEACFNAYARFHELCAPIKESLYIAKFDDVVSDIGAILADISERNGLDWPVYEKSDQNESYIMDVIEHSNRRRNSGQLREEGVARPSVRRRSPGEVISGLSLDQEKARKRAHAAYTALID